MYIILIAVFLLIILFLCLLFWAFKTAFMRSEIKIASFDFGPLAKYKSIFEESFKYFDTQKSERIYTQSFDGLKLAARYYKSGDSKTTVLLFHGYRSDGRFDFACVLKYYLELGLNVLVVDQRATGESEGTIITFGIKESQDVLAWVRYINEKYAPKNIFLSGVSMGASTVMMAADLKMTDNIRGIIADCGFTTAPDIIKKVALQSFKINASPILPFLNVLCKIFGRFSLYDASTVKSLANSDIPIYFIHGKNDGFVPCEMTVQSYNAARAEKYIHLVDGADHGMSFLVDTENIKNRIYEFIFTHCS